MEKAFQTQSDWFESKIIPRIRRRTIIGAFIIVLCVIAWLYYDSWIPLAIALFVLIERIFDFAHIPTTKKIIGSLNISVEENGLSFRGSGIKGNVVYPWSSLKYEILKGKNGVPEILIVENTSLKGSKVKLSGMEKMGELISQVENNAHKS